MLEGIDYFWQSSEISDREWTEFKILDLKFLEINMGYEFTKISNLEGDFKNSNFMNFLISLRQKNVTPHTFNIVKSTKITWKPENSMDKPSNHGRNFQQ